MGNIIRETACISSRYSNEFDVEMERGKRKKKFGRHDDALDQEQKKKEKKETRN